MIDGDNFDSGMMADEDATEDVNLTNIQRAGGMGPHEDYDLTLESSQFPEHEQGGTSRGSSDLTAERSLGGRKQRRSVEASN